MAENRGCAIDPEVLRVLSKVRTLRGLMAILGNWAVIVTAIWAAGSLDHLAAYAIAVVFVGNRMHGLAFLAHEAAHGLLAKPRWLNNVLGQVLCMWPLITDVFAYRAFHVRHHRYLNTPEDPELELRKRGAPSWDLPRKPGYFVFRFLFDLIGGCAASNIRLIGYAFPKTPGTILGMTITWGIAISLLALTDNLWVLPLWFITFATSLGTFLRFRIWLEHIGASDTHRLAFTWWQSWLFAPHYSWMHWEHHEWPSIPCWNLPRVRALMPEVQALTFRELFRFYRDCPHIGSGVPLRDRGGKSLLPARHS